MTQQIINIGVEGDDQSGESLRATGIKLNQNFDELYAAISTLRGQLQNAPTASRWQQQRVLLLQGEVTGSALVDGSDNILLKAQVTASPSLGANTVVRRDANGGFQAGAVDASSLTSSRPALAERYRSDSSYARGTVVVLGGSKEVTVTATEADPRVVGVIGSVPGLTLNASRGDDEGAPAVVLTGRTVCKVVGPVAKGDLLVTASTPGHAKSATNPVAGTIIGKAVQDFTGTMGLIEVVIALG